MPTPLPDAPTPAQLRALQTQLAGLRADTQQVVAQLAGLRSDLHAGIERLVAAFALIQKIEDVARLGSDVRSEITALQRRMTQLERARVRVVTDPVPPAR